MRKLRLTRRLCLIAAAAALTVLLACAAEALGLWGRLQTLLGVAPDTPPETDAAASVTVLDVGQGDAVLLRQGDGACLIDTGPAADRENLVDDLAALGVARLDLLVLTHPHADHVGGALAVLQSVEVARVWTSDTEYENDMSGWYRSALEYIDEQGIPIETPQAGQTCAVGAGTLTVLQAGFTAPQTAAAPTEADTADADAEAEDAVNDRSLCTRFTVGDFSYLSTGDAEQAAEAALVQTYGKELRSTVYKVGHHGSYTSSGAALLDAVKPTFAVISCGADNDYGHPHTVVLERLKAAGAEIWRTDTQGSVTLAYQDGAVTVTAAGKYDPLATPAANGQ